MRHTDGWGHDRHDVLRLISMTPRPLIYLTELPEAIAPGLMLVHNHFRPARLGSPGFRAWLQEPGNNLLGCDCGWAPELGRHYTVRHWSDD